MNKMNPRDQINKATWVVVESIRDAVANNIVQASQSGQVDIKGVQLEHLIAIINGSIDSGFQRCSKNFLREVDKVIDDVETTKKKKSPTV